MPNYKETVTLLNQTVTTTAVQSIALDVRRLKTAAFQITFPTSLEATFQLMGSLDNENFFDLGAVIAPADGTNTSSGWSDEVDVPFVAVQVTPTNGSGLVKVLGSGKGI